MSLRPIVSEPSADFSPETRGTKRPREEGEGSQLSKRAKLDKKITKLSDLIPKMRQEDDKKVIIEVQTSEGTVNFKLKKFQLFSLSSHFRTVFSEPWKEGQTNTMKWVGTGAMPNIHPQAAAQIIQLARRGTDFRDSQCRTLAELKDEYPDEFPVIFHDIVRLCAFYEINLLKEECIGFFLNELGSDTLKTMADHLPMILNPEFESFFSQCLSLHLSRVENLLEFLPAIGRLYQSDYPGFANENVEKCKNYLRWAFEKILESPDLDHPLKHELAAHEFNLSIGLCSALKDLYPRFDFSLKILLRMQRLIQPSSMGIPLVRDVMKVVYLICRTPFVFFPDPAPITSYPEGKVRIPEYSELGEVLESPKSGQRQIIDRFIERHPENAMALAIRGAYHFEEKNLAEAMKDYNRALELHQNFAFALSRAGSCLLELGQTEDGISFLQLALERDPFHTHALATLGEFYRKNNQLPLALDHLTRAIHNDFRHVAALVSRAKLFMKTGLLNSALHDLNHALRYQPHSVPALYCRGKCFLRMNAFDAALVDFYSLLKIKPDHSPALFLKGKCLMLKGNFDAAFPYIDHFLEENPDHVEALVMRGLIYKNQSDLDRALDLLDRAIDLDPKNVSALVIRAECYMETQNPDAALANLECALQIDPVNQKALELKKKCYEMKAKPRLRPY